MTTDVRVGLIQSIIREQGYVCEALGISREEQRDEDWTMLMEAVKRLDESTEALRKIIYDEAKVV